MSSRQFKLLVVLVVASGLAGGALGSWLLPGRAAFAEEEVRPGSGVMAAREFRLVDEEGRGQALLTMVEGQPGLGLYDEAGTPGGIDNLFVI